MTTKVEKSITVGVPVSMAYNQWTQFEDFPAFMGGVQKVEQLDDRRLHWVAEIAGVKREWYAEILEQRADEKIAWAATEGATNTGAVYFSPEGVDRTRVTLELEYEPEGLVEKVGDALRIVERQAQSDVEKFKSFIEARSLETGGWRGEVEGRTLGPPGVEAATSEGDSGKAGMSGKAAAVGVAAVAGAAAVAATRGRSSEDTEEEVVEVDTMAPPVTQDVLGVDVVPKTPETAIGEVEVDVDTVLDGPHEGAAPVPGAAPVAGAVVAPEDEIGIATPVADPDLGPGNRDNRDPR